MAIVLDSTRWVREVGIDVRGKRDWNLAFSLHDKPSRPPDIVSRKSTVFVLDVWAGFWCVHLYHLGAEFNCERTGRYPIMRRTTEPSPRLVLPLEVTFHRDRPRVWSNVKGAAKLITAWIAET